MATSRTRKIGDTTYRLVQEDEHKVVEYQIARGSWGRITRTELLAHSPDSELWEWLYKHGVTRPSPSGKTSGGAGSAASRASLRENGGAVVQVSFPPEEAATLEALAGLLGSKTAAVLRAVSELGERLLKKK